MPDSVVTLSHSAFEHSGLTTINISPNSKLEKIQDFCFRFSKLSSIFIPKSTKTIPMDAFIDCPLENITVDPENTNYKSDSKSFYTGTDNSTLLRVCVSYSGEYIIACYVTTINSYCFSYCINISSIQTNNSITSIGIFAFYNCSSLTNINIKGNLEGIAQSQFYNCESLANIIFNGNLNKIYVNSLSYHNSLINITITGNVSEIEDYAFSNCPSLTSFTILGNAKSINSNVFSRCSKLTDIIINGNISEIGSSAFSSCKSLKGIKIKGDITKIDEFTFGGCTSLTNFTIPETVTKIMDYAFSDCISLTKIIFPGSISTIKRSVFESCKNLKNVTFLNNSNSMEISYDAFSTIPNPINIYIPGNFNIEQSSATEAFPERSNLYITSETILSDDCDRFFGSKSVYVYIETSTKISDKTTNDVIKYIAISIKYPKAKQTFIYHQIKCLHILSLIPKVK